MDAEMLAAAGILIGVLIRMVIPALRKAGEEGEAFQWQHRYTIATAVALLVAFITTAIGFATYPIPENVSTFSFLIGASIYGYGLEAATIEGMKNVAPTPP